MSMNQTPSQTILERRQRLSYRYRWLTDGELHCCYVSLPGCLTRRVCYTTAPDDPDAAGRRIAARVGRLMTGGRGAGRGRGGSMKTAFVDELRAA